MSNKRRHRGLEIVATAYHEAGHIVVGTLLGIEYKAVWIKTSEWDKGPEWDTGPYAGGNKMVNPIRIFPAREGKNTESPERIKKHMIISFSGPIAESLFRGSTKLDFPTAAGDIEEALMCLEAIYEDKESEEASETFVKCQSKANEIVKENWNLIKDMASALMKKGTLNQSEIQSMVVKE